MELGVNRCGRWRVAAAAATLGGALVGAAGGAGGTPAGAMGSCPTKSGLTITCNVTYNSADGMQLDVYRPTGTTTLPGVMLVHGGGFIAGGKGGGLVSIAETIAAQNMVVMSINYTLATASKAGYPAEVTDTLAAVMWARSTTGGSQFGVDPTRIGGLGTSAGGTLVGEAADLGSGSRTQGSRLLAGVTWSGPMDLQALGCQSQASCLGGSPGALIAEYLGCYLTSPSCPAGGTLATYQAASPIDQVDPTDATMLQFNSSDETIPVANALSMAGILNTACVPHELVVLPGDQHAESYNQIAQSASDMFFATEFGPSPPTQCNAASPYTGASATTDPATGGVVLFGGCCNADGTFENTTRLFTGGSTLTTLNPPKSPTGRFGAAMAEDAATGTAVLFGGINSTGGLLAETWTWDGTTWTQQHPPTSPPARDAASMAYDSVHQRVVLFGGQNVPAGALADAALSDTWTWDGTNWTQQHPTTGGPSARYGAGMVGTASNVVLFGGNKTTNTKTKKCNGSCLDLQPDTWIWNGSTWTQQQLTTSPPPREYATMAYSPRTGTAVLFGGLNGTTSGTANGGTNTEQLLNDTWTWDGTAWSSHTVTTKPATRFGAAAGTDTATGDPVVVGGFDGSQVGDNQPWVWTGSAWQVG